METTVWCIVLGGGALYLLLCTFYYFFQERLIFVPLGILERDAKVRLGSDFDEYFLEGEEGGIIHAIHIKIEKPRGCVLYFHGNTGSMPRWGAIAEELTTFGFNVFLPDYRGYGKSRGKRTEAILYSDAMLCYDALKQMYPEQQICIYGRSLGSGVASWLASRVHSTALVLETPYNNMLDVARYHSRIIPVRSLLKYTFRNDFHLKVAKLPVLIAHGTKDNIVPYKLGLKLYEAIKPNGRASMLTIPGGHHGDLNGYPVFRKALERFFDKHFPKREES